MHRDGGEKKDPQRSKSQMARSTFRLPSPLTSNGSLSDIKARLISHDPAKLSAAAWDVREAASNGQDISALIPLIVPLVKTENGIARDQLMDAIVLYVRAGGDHLPAVSAISHCLEHNSMPLRSSALAAVAHVAENGGDITTYIDLLVKRLRDISPTNREDATNALIAYAGRGSKEAENVIAALGDLHCTEADFVRMVCRDVPEE